MKPYLSLVFCIISSCTIISSEESSFDPNENSLSEEILEYNPYAQPKRKKGGNKSQNNSHKKRKNAPANKWHNRQIINDLNTQEINWPESYDLYPFCYFDTILQDPFSNNKNETFPSKINNNSFKKTLIINHIKNIESSAKYKSSFLEQKNEDDRKKIIENNTHIKKEDLEKCFEILKNANPNIPLKKAIGELQKKYNELKK